MSCASRPARARRSFGGRASRRRPADAGGPRLMASPARSSRCWSIRSSASSVPNHLYDGKQIIRAGLEDHFCGKLLGAPLGVDVCYTNHAEADQDEHGQPADPAGHGGASPSSWACRAPTT
ncbi:ethanolamine ammonia-lyase subunit EutB [Caulobacter segnis]